MLESNRRIFLHDVFFFCTIREETTRLERSFSLIALTSNNLIPDLRKSRLRFVCLAGNRDSTEIQLPSSSPSSCSTAVLATLLSLKEPALFSSLRLSFKTASQERAKRLNRCSPCTANRFLCPFPPLPSLSLLISPLLSSPLPAFFN